MIRPEPEKWNQTLANLHQMSVEAEHARTRERFLALYMIGSGQTNATQWAIETGHDDNTVTTKRTAYIDTFQTHFAQVCQGEVRLLYRDESHFHRDIDLGYTWQSKAKPLGI